MKQPHKVSLMIDAQNKQKLSSKKMIVKTCLTVPSRENIAAKLMKLYDDDANELHAWLTVLKNGL